MNKKWNINLLTFLLVGITAVLLPGCTKDKDVDQGYTIKTGQPVTPALYASIRGKWNYCDPYYADARKGWYMQFINDSIMVFNHTTETAPLYKDTLIYKLTQNTYMGPTGANSLQAVYKSERTNLLIWSIEIGKSDGLYIGDQRYCKQ